MCISAHRKRPIEEVSNFDGLSDSESVPNATVHATITSLSPTKKCYIFQWHHHRLYITFTSGGF